jgi:hypothetical protein
MSSSTSPPNPAGTIRLYRAVSSQELADIHGSGVLRPGPPSYQGKWLAESSQDAARWGRRFYRQSGTPFHIIEIEVQTQEADRWHRNPFLDRIGPARYADIVDLPAIRFIGELPAIPVRPP